MSAASLRSGSTCTLADLVQVDTLSFLVLVPLLIYCVCRFWDWLRVAVATAPRDFWYDSDSL